MRDRLLVELAGLASANEAAGWAHRALGLKNTLTGVDAGLVEDAFRAKMAGLTATGADEAQVPASAAAVASRELGLVDAEEASTLNAGGVSGNGARRKRRHAAATGQRIDAAQAEPAGDGSATQPREAEADRSSVDKSVLALSEPRRYRDRGHLKFVASQPCLLCGRHPSDAHHIRFAQATALGRRVSDEFTVPLCRLHHRSLHRRGDEAAWWSENGRDPIEIAKSLWTESRVTGLSTLAGQLLSHQDPAPAAAAPSASPAGIGPLEQRQTLSITDRRRTGASDIPGVTFGTDYPTRR